MVLTWTSLIFYHLAQTYFACVSGSLFSFQCIGMLMESIFKQLKDLKITTVALPAFGTGSLKYSEKIVAMEMMRSIYLHAANFGLQMVNLVAYQKDTQIYVRLFKCWTDLFVTFSSTGRRPASYCHGVNSSFKKLLLRNYWLDFYHTPQECSLGGPALPRWLSGERVGLMTWWLWVRSPVEAFFLSGIFLPLTSAEACEKSSRCLWEEKLC